MFADGGVTQVESGVGPPYKYGVSSETDPVYSCALRALNYSTFVYLVARVHVRNVVRVCVCGARVILPNLNDKSAAFRDTLCAKGNVIY